MKQYTNEDINIALPKIKVGLDKYCEIQRLFDKVNINLDKSFQKKFNGFYRVRRNEQWRNIFFELMENSRNDKNIKFENILNILKNETNRIEASFTSKLIATINTDLPVLDSFVLNNMNLSLPIYSSKDRVQKTVEIYDELIKKMNELKNSDNGKYMILKFKEFYPDYIVSEMKMLDLILWQSR